jgi:hypothetical protein
MIAIHRDSPMYHHDLLAISAAPSTARDGLEPIDLNRL